MTEFDIHAPTIDSPPFYLTKAQPCPYLEGRTERKLFTILQGEDASQLNDVLSGCGFRRSQNIAYRPACDGCRACYSCRIPVKQFKVKRTLKRIAKHNSDLIALTQPCKATSEQYRLFQDYVMERHDDGGMSQMSVLDYAMMVEETHVNSLVREYRLKDIDSTVTGTSQGPLKAAAISDVLRDGLSMVYSFYDPSQASRSLGTYMILDHIALAQRMELDYVYLGYWVRNSPKMAYKARFKPLEILTGEGWLPFDDPSSQI